MSWFARSIKGWAYDTFAPDVSVTLELRVDGRYATTIACDGFRKADPADEVPHNHAGFKSAVPMEFWDGKRHAVSLVDPARALVLIEQDIVVPRYLVAGTPVPVYGQLIDIVDGGVTGWVTDTHEPLRVELEIDGELIEAVVADGALPEQALADFAAAEIVRGGFAFRLPVRFLDGADHLVAVAVVLADGARVPIQQRRVSLAREDELVVSGVFEPLRHSRLAGRATRPDAPDESLEVSLVLDGAEIGSTRTDPAAGGAFAFDLSGFTLPELIDANFAVAVFPSGPEIPFMGQHPARDALAVQFEAEDSGGIVARVEGGAALSDMLGYRVASGGRAVADGLVGGVAGEPEHGIVTIDAATAADPDLVLTIAGMSFPVRVPLGGKAEASGPVRSIHPLGSFVAPGEDRVRRHLGSLARSVSPEEAAGDPDYTGVWRLANGVVEGWAVPIGGGAGALSVELAIDGEVAASQAATLVVQPREAKVLFQVPIGFRFALARLDLAAGSHEIIVRVAGGHMLLPSHPRLYQQVETDRDERLIARIDALVERHAPFQAVLLARAAPSRVAGVQDRRAMLDFATRGEWHDYAAALARHRTPANGELLDHLDRLARSRDDEALAGLRTLTAELSLPPAYLDLVEENVAPTAAAFAERLAFTVALRDAPTEVELAPDHGGLAIACAFGRDDAGAEARERMDALDRAGCHVSWHAPAPTEEIVATLDATLPAACRLVMVLREPRLIDLAAAGLWPRLIGAGPPLVTVATISDEIVPAAERELAGRQFDPSTVIAVRSAASPADDALAPSLECMTWRCHESSAAASTPTCVIVRFQGVDLPAAPVGARVIRVAPGERPLDAVRDAIAGLAGALAPSTPVIVQLPDYSYPPDHIESCLRAFALAGDRSLVTFAVDYDPEQMRFLPSADGTGSRFLGLIGFGCYRLDDLLAGWTHDRGPPTHLVPAGDQPFAQAGEPTLPELLGEVRLLLDQPGSLIERELAFQAFARATASRSGKGGRNHLSENASKALLQLYPSPFPQDAVSELIGLGRLAEAKALLIDWVLHAQPLSGTTEPELKAILEATKRLSAQRELAAIIGPQVPQLAAACSSLLIPLFEILASVSTPADVGASLIVCCHFLIAGKSTRPLYRVIDLCRRYSSPHTMIALLHLIDASSRAALLGSNEIGRVVGEALIDAEASDFTLPVTRLDRRHFLARAPLTLQIVAALRAGERASVVRLINAFLATRRDAKRLIGALRTYSWELSQLAFAADEILYPAASTTEERLALAIVLGDLATIDALDPGDGPLAWTPEGSPEIAAGTYFGRFEPLDAWFRQSSANIGVEPLRFGGTSVENLFRHLSEQQAPAQSALAGRLTVLLTVFNPDLVLLDLSLTSLLRQTHGDLEVILIDDASDLVAADEIAALAARDPRVRFLRMNRNSGPYLCRNKGLELATGDYIAIQDDDDFSHPQRFERQIAALAEGDMLKLCTTAHLRIDRGGRLQFEHTLGILGDGTMTSMFRREVFEALGPFATVRSRGDVEFRERIKGAFGQHVYVHLPCPMVFCFATPGSLSNTTARTLPGYLALFRDNFAKRAQLPFIGASGGGGRPVVAEVPWPLRPA